MNLGARVLVAITMGFLVAASAEVTPPARAAVANKFSNGYGGFAWRPQAVGKSGDKYKTPASGDPITLIFAGGGLAGQSQVENAFQDDWDPGAKPPSDQPALGDWKNHSINPACTHDKLYLQFNWLRTSDTVANSFTGSTNPRTRCLGNQYHGRFWTDHVHARQSGQPEHMWTVGAAHHDHLAFVGGKMCIPHTAACIPKVKHQLDVPWDLARVAILRGLHSHCTYRIWHVNPAARLRYGGKFTNSGRISRISMHTGRPCDGR